ncbi:MAG: SH3 domain-containing protein [Clostridia bacterium]|nr:SH3 domain-containing protein [Clostridia bacterium]
MKRILIIFLTFILVLGTLTSCKVVKRKTDTTDGTDKQTETSEVPETDPVMDLSNHIGKWHPKSQPEEKELSIDEVSDNFVIFSLNYKSGPELKNITAIRSGDTAVFGMDETVDTIAGELIFGNSFIKLRIDDTNVSYYEVGLTVYDGKGSYTETTTAETTTAAPTPPPDQPYDSSRLNPPPITCDAHTRYVNTGGDTLHLRIGAGQNYTSLCLMPHNAAVTVYGYNPDGSWSYVYYSGKAVYGWCFSRFLGPSQTTYTNYVSTTAHTKYVSTGGDTLHIRTGPGMDYKSLGLMPHNSAVTVYGYSYDGAWSYVYYGGKGIYGWCYTRFLRNGISYSTSTRYVNTGGETLHIRSGPGTGYKSLGLMPHNAAVTVYSYNYDGTWAYISYGGIYGWCFTRFLR